MNFKQYKITLGILIEIFSGCQIYIITLSHCGPNILLQQISDSWNWITRLPETPNASRVTQIDPGVWKSAFIKKFTPPPPKGVSRPGVVGGQIFGLFVCMAGEQKSVSNP